MRRYSRNKKKIDRNFGLYRERRLVDGRFLLPISSCRTHNWVGTHGYTIYSLPARSASMLTRMLAIDAWSLGRGVVVVRSRRVDEGRRDTNKTRLAETAGRSALGTNNEPTWRKCAHMRGDACTRDMFHAHCRHAYWWPPDGGISIYGTGLRDFPSARNTMPRSGRKVSITDILTSPRVSRDIRTSIGQASVRRTKMYTYGVWNGRVPSNWLIQMGEQISTLWI